jgi:hypothetical protein
MGMVTLHTIQLGLQQLVKSILCTIEGATRKNPTKIQFTLKRDLLLSAFFLTFYPLIIS